MPEISDEKWAALNERLERIEAGQRNMRPVTPDERAREAREAMRRGYAAADAARRAEAEGGES